MTELDINLPTIRRLPLGEQVAEMLRNLISTDRLKPGDRIVEAEWATRLSVSRGPVRDAIRQLAAEGLITCPPKGSAYVAEPSLGELRALVGLRYRMEEYAIELAIERITPGGVAELRQLIEELRDARDRHDEELLRELDARYHRTLWGWAGSARLTELLSLVISPLLLARLWRNWPGDVLAAHEQVAGAIARGDVAAARVALRTAMQVSLDGLEHGEGELSPGADLASPNPSTNNRRA